MSRAPSSRQASRRSISTMSENSSRWARETRRWLASAAAMSSSLLRSSCLGTRDLTGSRGEIAAKYTPNIRSTVNRGGARANAWGSLPGYEFRQRGTPRCRGGRSSCCRCIDADQVSRGADGLGGGLRGVLRALLPPGAQAMFLMTGDRSEAEDLAQEAMARVYERWRRVRGMGRRRATSSTALNLNRKRLRRLAVRSRHNLPGGDAARGADPLPASGCRTSVHQRKR